MGKHLQVSGTPTTGQVPTYGGSSAAWATPASSGGGGSGLLIPSAANLTSGNNSGTISSQATASITPTASKLVLLTVSIRNGNSINPTAPTVSGNGLTWVQIGNCNFDATSTSRRTIYVFRAMGVAPSAGAVTVTFGEAETDIGWVIDQISNVSTSGTNGSGAVVQSVVATPAVSSPLSITLAGLSNTGNATYGAMGTDGGATPAAGTGYTILATGEVAGIETATTEFKAAGSTVVDMTWATGTGFGGVAMELAAASAAVTSVNGNSGVVVLTKADIGLSNSDNTSDVNKPVSTAQAIAIALKQNLVALTTTGTSGAATFNQSTGALNIPSYAGGGSGITRTVATVTTTVTLGATASTDYVTFIGASGVVTLPTAVGNTNCYTLKNVHTTNKTVATTLSQTIDGSTTITLTPNTSVDLVSDNANWRII